MKIVSHYSSTPFQEFEGDVVHGVTGRVVIGKDDGAANFCMRIFTLAPGGFTPRHSHEWEHEILIHEGAGQVNRDNEWVDVSSGSVVFIPGNEEHQFRNNSDANLVFACLIPKGAPEL
ncbi:MAG: cupin domain-containing protein [Desulfocapsaceae bacterium]|jgi:quercetin dioxygenase-like cupin family protein|nr:cupin domain-containing protein [Desulfocapsaceae bacterium]